MGEAKRRREGGFDIIPLHLGEKFKPLRPGEQIQIDLKNATQRVCECGCKFFIPVVMLYTVSALMSPTGQELTAQQPVLICNQCGELLK